MARLVYPIIRGAQDRTGKIWYSNVMTETVLRIQGADDGNTEQGSADRTTESDGDRGLTSPDLHGQPETAEDGGGPATSE
jgi:hypothetical protein